MKKKFIVITVLLISFLFIAVPSHAITLGFDPVSQAVKLGDSVSVDIVISGLGLPDYLSIFDLDITYDPTILSFTGWELGPYLGDISLSQAADLSFGDPDDPPSGTVDLYELSLLWEDAFQDEYFNDPGNLDGPPYLEDLQVTNSFLLATLYFDTVSYGTSSLVILDELSDPYFFLGDGWAEPLDADFESGSISVVPEPSTMLLLGSGLTGLAGLRKKF